MTQENIPAVVTGRCIISDDLGNIVLNKENAIHAQNMSRAFSRALSNESNYFINRMAFGNGGTAIDASNNISYNKPRDGTRPYDLTGYKSRLYNETYSEQVNENNPGIGSGAGASPLNDPISIVNNIHGPGVVSVETASTEKGAYSQVYITCVLNRFEPTGEYLSSITNTVEAADGSFTFDEIGLFTGGVPSEVASNGYQTVTISTPNLYVKTGLTVGETYSLPMIVDGVAVKYSYTAKQVSSIITDKSIRYIDLINQLNADVTSPVVFSMRNGSSSTSTFGYLKVTSKINGSESSVVLTPSYNDGKWLFNNLPLFVRLNESVQGSAQGVQNMPDYPSKELSRMLTHLIFDPITKPADRVYVIHYILDINVPPTQK
jgi:hypothetical protein